MSDSAETISSFTKGGTHRSKSMRDIHGVRFMPNAVREFLPEIAPLQIEKIKNELHGMIGQRIVLSSDDIVQVRRAVNVLLQDANQVLSDAMKSARVVALLSSDAAAGAPSVSALYEGGATHLAMNLPKVFQDVLNRYQIEGEKTALAELLKHRGFKHPLSLLESAAELGVKLVAVGDQQMDSAEGQSASIQSVAFDVAALLDSERRHKVILWAGSHYLKRGKDAKVCHSAVDYLALNYNVFTIHNGNYLVDGGPLRKIVFDLQCPGALISGRNRIIDNLATGLEGNNYGDWNAVLLQPRPASDHSYFLTND